MSFNFLKKIFGSNKTGESKKEGSSPVPAPVKKTVPSSPPEGKKAENTIQPEMSAEVKVKEIPAKVSEEPKKEKPLSEKTDEDLAKELGEMSPELLAQAKTPEMRKMVVNIYRKMLEDKVDVNDEKEVKKWLKKNPEVARGGEPAPKVDTYKRENPKVGRNDPCPCGSGKKYKKCCGKEK